MKINRNIVVLLAALAFAGSRFTKRCCWRMFGVTQPLSGIRKVELKEDAPVDTYKTNGMGIDDIRRGSFDVEGLGNGRLYAHLSQKPFIYITTDTSFIIINFKDSTKTQQLYDEIMKNWKAG